MFQERRHPVPLFSGDDGLLYARSSRGVFVIFFSFVEVFSAVFVVAPVFLVSSSGCVRVWVLLL